MGTFGSLERAVSTTAKRAPRAIRRSAPPPRPTGALPSLTHAVHVVARRAPQAVRHSAPPPRPARRPAPQPQHQVLVNAVRAARAAAVLNLIRNRPPVVSGKVSWFGGPNDSMAGPTTATGASVKTPGIAVYNKHTLGGYWRVELPKQRRIAILKQTDLGPAPSTGRKVDVTYSALPKLGFNEKSFPTDTKVKATYLGSRPPRLGF